MTDASVPRGAEAVRTSLVAAASELFASRGPSRVSVREVARSAGVNHGLVHHYFGSKDALLRAVLDELAVRAAAEVEEWDGSSEIVVRGGPADRHGRIVAHLLLEARNPAEVQTAFPTIDALAAELRTRGLRGGARRPSVPRSWRPSCSDGSCSSPSSLRRPGSTRPTPTIGHCSCIECAAPAHRRSQQGSRRGLSQTRSRASFGLAGSSVSGSASSDTVGPNFWASGASTSRSKP